MNIYFVPEKNKLLNCKLVKKLFLNDKLFHNGKNGENIGDRNPGKIIYIILLLISGCKHTFDLNTLNTWSRVTGIEIRYTSREQ